MSGLRKKIGRRVVILQGSELEVEEDRLAKSRILKQFFLILPESSHLVFIPKFLE